MHLNNKTMIHRGFDFMRQDSGQLTLDWASDRSSKENRPQGGDICMLRLDATSGKMKLFRLDQAVAAGTAVTTTAEVDAIRDKIYVCYQGGEESENSLFKSNDKYIKLRDLFLSIQLKNIDSTQFGEIAIGDALRVDDAGMVGTESITSDLTGGFTGTDATEALIIGTTITEKTIGTDIDGNEVYIVKVVC